MIKKIFFGLSILLTFFFLLACQSEEKIEPSFLPDLTGLNKTLAAEALDQIGIDYTFIDVIDNDIRSGRFLAYEDGFQAGMEIEEGISIIVYFVKYANTLPNLSGLNQEEIIVELDKFDFNYTFEFVVTSLVDDGLFLSYAGNYQTGDTLPLGSDITIRIAEAPDTTIFLPDLRFKYEEEIIQMMTALQLDFSIEEVENNNLPQGQFIAYGNDLQIGDSVSIDTGVIIFIAKHVNRLPDLTGKDITQIFIEMNKINVVIEIRTYPTNDVPEGLFVSYLNRNIGQIVPEGAAIVIYIAEPIIEVNRNLMISTYVEGTLFNRAIELYNTSAEPIDLSEFTIAQLLDGSQKINIEIPLEGILMPYQVYVIAHSSAHVDIKNKADLLTDQLFFNGNDTIQLLYYNGEIVDQVAWIIQLLNDRTLSRKVHITQPSPIFDYNDWDVYSNDYFRPLGSHPTPFPTSFTYDEQFLSIPFPESGGMIKVTFISNNDGDTAQFSPGFTGPDRVRFVGIDTAETGSGVLAILATEFVYNILSNATEIYLQQDPSSGTRETFGRYLALIWADGVLVNYEIIKHGYAANSYFDYNRFFSLNGVDLNIWMRLAENHAKANQLGMWG